MMKSAWCKFWYCTLRFLAIELNKWYNNLTKHNPNQRFGVFRRTLNHTASAQRAFATWYNNLISGLYSG